MFGAMQYVNMRADTHYDIPNDQQQHRESMISIVNPWLPASVAASGIPNGSGPSIQAVISCENFLLAHGIYTGK